MDIDQANLHQLATEVKQCALYQVFFGFRVLNRGIDK